MIVDRDSKSPDSVFARRQIVQQVVFEAGMECMPAFFRLISA
ncbi:hypothetical protein AB3X85_24825 [Paraburkholderia phenoliruptrix]